MKHWIMGLVVGIVAGVLTPTGRAQESMERSLLKQAPKLIKYFKEHDYKNVGVLKFLVSREGKPFSDNIGTLNLLAARRLELALVLANDPRNPVGIIDNASAVAHTIAGASHLSKEGRQKLFAAQYPRAWGKDLVQADAFVTGTSEISSDLRKITISLYCFDRVTAKLEPLGDDFQVANATDRLGEMGESFVLRGAFDDGQTETTSAKQREHARQEAIYQQAVKVREQMMQHPAQQEKPPVTLDIYYDDAKAPLEFRDGQAYVAEPREGQTVQFGLRRDSGKDRYGVVLKVNGENTLDKQRLPDLSCRAWVLDSGYGPWSIGGFHIGTDVREKFRVASVAESRQREINYGHDVGTISMTVFRELKAKAKQTFLDEDEQYQIVLKKLPDLRKRPGNYQALKAQLLEDANRGLIVEGQRETSKVEVVPFVADPKPIMCLTVRYYRK
jgi:hypothetical protein